MSVYYNADTSGMSVYYNVCRQTYILLKFDEDMCYQMQMPFTFVILFSDIGQCCRPDQKNGFKNQKFVTSE